MNLLISFILVEIWLILLSITSIIAFQLITGRIETKGLLADKSTGNLSPARIQLLVLTLTGAFFYLFKVIQNTELTKFPNFPKELLYLIGGSNFIYIGIKAYVMLIRRITSEKEDVT